MRIFTDADGNVSWKKVAVMAGTVIGGAVLFPAGLGAVGGVVGGLVGAGINHYALSDAKAEGAAPGTPTPAATPAAPKAPEANGLGEDLLKGAAGILKDNLPRPSLPGVPPPGGGGFTRP